MIGIAGKAIIPIINQRGPLIGKNGIDLDRDLTARLYLPGYPYTGATIFDRSAASPPNNGTITGATWVRLPSGLWYLDHNGTDQYVTWTNWTLLSTGEVFGFELWARPDRDGTLETLMGLGEGTLYDLLTLDRTATGAIRFRVGNAADTAFTALFTSTSTTSAPINIWHHFMACYNQAATPKSAILVDGVNLAGTDTGNGTNRTKTPILLLIGAYKSTHIQDFDGGTTLQRIYNADTRALALSHYQQTKWLFGRY